MPGAASDPDCLFCKIVKREIPASIVYEDGRLLAFNDINPQAPTHVLIVPKRHIATLNDLTAEDESREAAAHEIQATTHGSAALGERHASCHIVYSMRTHSGDMR